MAIIDETSGLPCSSTYLLHFGSLREAYGITLMCGDFKDRMPEWDGCNIDDWLRQDWPGALFGGHVTSRGTYDSPPSTSMDLATNKALHYCENRIFIETGEGYIGLAHEDTKLGE